MTKIIINGQSYWYESHRKALYFESKQKGVHIMTHNIIGYKVTEECTLQFHNFEYGEEIIIADHCEDHDWLGTEWYDNYPQIFEPIYSSPAPVDMSLIDDHLPGDEEEQFTKGEWQCSPVMNFSDTLISYIATSDKEVAQLRGCTNGEEKEAEANAHLIAASKNLYYALKECREWYEKIGFRYLAPETPVCFSKALSVLLKASPNK